MKTPEKKPWMVTLGFIVMLGGIGETISVMGDKKADIGTFMVAVAMALGGYYLIYRGNKG